MTGSISVLLPDIIASTASWSSRLSVKNCKALLGDGSNRRHARKKTRTKAVKLWSLVMIVVVVAVVVGSRRTAQKEHKFFYVDEKQQWEVESPSSFVVASKRQSTRPPNLTSV